MVTEDFRPTAVRFQPRVRFGICRYVQLQHSIAEMPGHFLDQELLKTFFQEHLFLDSHSS